MFVIVKVNSAHTGFLTETEVQGRFKENICDVWKILR